MDRRTPLAAAAVLIAFLTGCGGSLPSSPGPLPPPTSTTPTSPPPSQPTVAAGEWNLTTTLSAATGPAGCVVDISHMHVGDSYRSWVLTMERSGDAVDLVFFDFFNASDRYEYAGTVVGDVLTVPGTSYSSAGYCGQKGGRVEFSGENHLSGRFSEDRTSLTASEDMSLRLTSGEAITFHYDWVAHRAQ